MTFVFEEELNKNSDTKTMRINPIIGEGMKYEQDGGMSGEVKSSSS
jgi:hypothetical protein